MGHVKHQVMGGRSQYLQTDKMLGLRGSTSNVSPHSMAWIKPILHTFCDWWLLVIVGDCWWLLVIIGELLVNDWWIIGDYYMSVQDGWL